MHAALVSALTTKSAPVLDISFTSTPQVPNFTAGAHFVGRDVYTVLGMGLAGAWLDLDCILVSPNPRVCRAAGLQLRVCGAKSLG